MLAPHKPKSAPHIVACPDCAGSGGENGYSCCGGQGCARGGGGTCWRECETCDGIGSVEGYETCDGEIVSVDETFALHHGREDRACPVEDCSHCDPICKGAAMSKHATTLSEANHPILFALVASGAIRLVGAFGGREYVGVAADGVEVHIGDEGLEEGTEAYLQKHSTPETW